MATRVSYVGNQENRQLGPVESEEQRSPPALPNCSRNACTKTHLLALKDSLDIRHTISLECGYSATDAARVHWTPGEPGPPPATLEVRFTVRLKYSCGFVCFLSACQTSKEVRAIKTWRFKYAHKSRIKEIEKGNDVERGSRFCAQGC